MPLTETQLVEIEISKVKMAYLHVRNLLIFPRNRLAKFAKLVIRRVQLRLNRA